MELKEIQEIFQGDRFAREMGAEIVEARQGYARCVLPLTEHHKNAAGGVMGGVLFTLADFAFAVAANYEQMTTVSLTSPINLLSRVKGTCLEAAATCIKAGRNTCCYHVTITDDLGTLVAQLTTIGFTAATGGEGRF